MTQGYYTRNQSRHGELQRKGRTTILLFKANEKRSDTLI